MARMPPDLEADGREYLASQQISMIEAVRRQIDRIAYLRSAGAPWAEAVQQLRDMVVGLEDEQFWDGMPPKIRKQHEEMDGRSRAAKRLAAEWAPRGWLGVPVRAFQLPGGRIKWSPTPENLSDQLRIILSLLDRQGLLWKTRRMSPLPPPREA